MFFTLFVFCLLFGVALMQTTTSTLSTSAAAVTTSGAATSTTGAATTGTSTSAAATTTSTSAAATTTPPATTTSTVPPATTTSTTVSPTTTLAPTTTTAAPTTTTTTPAPSTSSSAILETTTSSAAGNTPMPTPIDNTKTLVIGALYPKIEDGHLLDLAGRFALDSLNAGEQGFKNLEQSGVSIVYLSRDSKGEQRDSLEQTIYLQENGAQVIIGPSFSSESIVTSLLANVYQIPAISYSATSPELSDKEDHPFFFRNVPSDNAQGQALVDLVIGINQKRCILIHTEESYGFGIAEVFRQNALASDLNIAGTVTIPDFENTAEVRNRIATAMDTVKDLIYYGEDKSQLQDVGTIVYLGPSSAGLGEVLRAGSKIGITGDPFVWISADGGSSIDFANENITASMGLGLISTSLKIADNAKFQSEFNPRWQALAANQTMFEFFGELKPLDPVVNVFAPFVYDAFLLAFKAIDTLYGQGKLDFTGEELRAALIETEVDGVTGLNTFDESQDRPPTYDIVNALRDGTSLRFSTVGTYTTEAGLTYNQPLTFSNGENTAPVFEKPPEPLSTEFYVLIVVASVLVACALLVCITVLVRRTLKKRREAAYAASNAPALQWAHEEEREELAARESEGADLEKSHTLSSLSAVDQRLYPVARADETAALFGVARGTRCAIQVELHDELLLSNMSDKSVKYDIYLPEGEDAFTLTAKPGTGVLKSKETKRVQLTFTLHFTTKIARWIKVTFNGIEGAVFVALRVEGEVSTRLDPMELELYGKPLGEGAFGSVYRGRYRGTQVAAKVPRRQAELTEKQLKEFHDEIELFEKLRNPYIVNFVGASHVTGKLCICTELLERGTVFDLIHKAKVSLVLKVKMAHDTSCALAFLHKNGVLYRDLKPDNLMVFSVSHSASVTCKLSDFGTAITVEDPTVPKRHTGSIGTPVYMAPEVMADMPYNSKIDVYSLAIFLWELMSEKQPFAELKRIWDLPRLVLDGMRPQLRDDWDERITKIISDCWLQSAERRPDMEEVQARLLKIYEKLKKTYEKDRKGRKDDSGVVPAHTGQLEKLVQMAAENATPLPTGQKAKFQVASDMQSDSSKPTVEESSEDVDDSGSYESGSYETDSEYESGSYETESGEEEDGDEEESTEDGEGSYSYETTTESEN